MGHMRVLRSLQGNTQALLNDGPLRTRNNTAGSFQNIQTLLF